jgi:nitroreductase
VLIGCGSLALAATATAAVTIQQMGSMESYRASSAATRARLAAHPALKDLIRLATLAPSGHNNQPWRFRTGQHSIDILPDFSRRTPVVDPDDHHLFTSLGCAGETLQIAAAASGRPGDLSFDSAAGGAVVFSFTQGAVIGSALSDAITRRQSTRTEYDGRPVAPADLQRLAAASAIPGVDFVLITDRPVISRVRDLVVSANGAQMAQAAFVQELKSWLRFNPRQASATGDGLFSVASGSPSVPTWLGPTMFDLAFSTKAENAKYARQLNSSSGIAVFVAQQADRQGWVQAGRACQRFALQATALGLQVSFVNQPVEVARLRPELAALLGMPGRRPDIVMRFGRGPTLPFSPRRPVDAVLA